MKTEITNGPLGIRQSKIVAAELRVIERTQRVITPAAVVARAESPDNPLHGYFEWDDSEAARKYRLWQARELIAKVYVTPIDRPDSEPVRAFVNIKTEGDSEEFGQGYVSTSGLDRQPHYQEQVLSYAKQQLLTWRKKFGGFSEFFGIVQEIDKLSR